MSITPSKQTSVYRQVDAILKTEDIYGGDKYTDIAENCDTMWQKRNLNPLYSSILNTISGVDS